jgi:hypothetical protein
MVLLDQPEGAVTNDGGASLTMLALHTGREGP